MFLVFIGLCVIFLMVICNMCKLVVMLLKFIFNYEWGWFDRIKVIVNLKVVLVIFNIVNMNILK